MLELYWRAEFQSFIFDLSKKKKNNQKKKKKSFTGYSLVGLERLKIHFFRAVSSVWYVISKKRMPIGYPIFLGLVSRLGINYGGHQKHTQTNKKANWSCL